MTARLSDVDLRVWPAASLEPSENALKVHHGQIPRKIRAKTLVDLVRTPDKVGVSGGQTN